jgi:uncharacterized membrane protein YbhN (UPF0104 family)
VKHLVEAQRARRWQEYIPYRVLAVALSALLLGIGVIVLYERIVWTEVVAIWLRLDTIWFLAAIVAYWMLYPANSFRLQLVISWIKETGLADSIPFKLVLRLACVSAFVATAAPVGLVGDLARVAGLHLFAKLSRTDAVRCTLFDRVLGAQCASVIGLLLLPVQSYAGVPVQLIYAQLLVFGAVVAAVGVLLLLPRILSVADIAILTRVSRLFAGYSAVLTVRRSLVQLLIGFVNMVLAWGSLYFIFRAAGLSANVWLVAGFIPFLQLINGLPFLYMGWGGREVAMAAILGTVTGLSLNEGVAVSTAWGVTLIIAGAINGVFLLGDWQPKRGITRFSK